MSDDPSPRKLLRLPLSAIVIADRARTRTGDLTALMDSIRRVGLLHPLVINSRSQLIAGGRRLAAVKGLGWSEVDCTVADTLDDALAALLAERDENTCREELALTDMVALGKRIEETEKPQAKARQEATRRGTNPGGGKCPPPGTLGKTRDKVGAALGVSGKTYEHAKKVVANGTPELVAATDAKRLSVATAARVSQLPADEQRAVVAAADPKEAAKAATAPEPTVRTAPAAVAQPARLGTPPLVLRDAIAGLSDALAELKRFANTRETERNGADVATVAFRLRAIADRLTNEMCGPPPAPVEAAPPVAHERPTAANARRTTREIALAGIKNERDCSAFTSALMRELMSDSSRSNIDKLNVAQRIAAKLRTAFEEGEEESQGVLSDLLRRFLTDEVSAKQANVTLRNIRFDD